MAKKKWNWKYRHRLGVMQISEFKSIHNWVKNNCGQFEIDWDISYKINMRYNQYGKSYYSRVVFFFKSDTYDAFFRFNFY